MEKSTENAISSILSSIKITPTRHVHNRKLAQSVGKRRLSDEGVRIMSKRNKARTPRAISQTFNPYDTAKLMERMASFEILKWTVDDDRLNPLVCSRYGWRCVQKNELECATCHAVMMVKLELAHAPVFYESDSEDDEEMRSSLVDSYLTRLKEDHYANCPWRSRQVPISSYLLDYTDRDALMASLDNNSAELLENIELLNSKRFVLVPEAEGLGNRLVMTVALLGWELKVQSFGTRRLSLLKCPRCLRRILLSEVTQPVRAGVLESVEYPPQLPEEGDEDDIDVVGEHQPWCAFVALTEKERVPGYKLVARMAVIRSEDDSMGEGRFDYLKRALFN